MKRALFWVLGVAAFSGTVYLPIRRCSQSQEQAVRRTLAIVGPLAGGFFLLRRFGPGGLSSPWDPSPDGEPVNLDTYYEDVKLESTDGLVLDAWWVPQKRSFRAAVLAPGRGGSKSRRYAVEAAQAYAREGLNVLMLSLRSQGASEGRFLSAGYHEVRDIHGALKWLKERGIEAKNVVLHGWSSGGAAVLQAAPGTGVGAVVEEGAYADLPLLLGSKLPWHEGPSNVLNWMAFLVAKALGVEFDPWALRPRESAARLYEEGVPLLIIQSVSATEVPFEHAELIKEAHPGAELWVLEGYAHVSAYEHPEYKQKLRRFLRDTVGSRRAWLRG